MTRRIHSSKTLNFFLCSKFREHLEGIVPSVCEESPSTYADNVTEKNSKDGHGRSHDDGAANGSSQELPLGEIEFEDGGYWNWRHLYQCVLLGFLL